MIMDQSGSLDQSRPLPHIQDIPDEILLMIFEYFDTIPREFDEDAQTELNTLCAAAFTCRQFWGPAQEILFRTTIMRASYSNPLGEQASDSDPLGEQASDSGFLGEAPRSVGQHLIYCIHLLMEKNRLASAVRHLRFEVFDSDDILHYLDDRHRRHFLFRCEDLIVSKFGRDPLADAGATVWRHALRLGYEPAFLGILLILTPNVKSLWLSARSERDAAVGPAELFGLTRRVITDSPGLPSLDGMDQYTRDYLMDPKSFVDSALRQLAGVISFCI